jgi:hypothetical protein
MWRSQVNLDYKGKGDFDIDPAFRSQLPPDGDITTSISLPQTFAGGVAFNATPELQLEVNAMWIDWSKFNELRIALPGGAETVSPQDYEDTVTLRVGAEYALPKQKAAVRAGYVYDPTPIPSTTVSATLPDGGPQRPHRRRQLRARQLRRPPRPALDHPGVADDVGRGVHAPVQGQVRGHRVRRVGLGRRQLRQVARDAFARESTTAPIERSPFGRRRRFSRTSPSRRSATRAVRISIRAHIQKVSFDAERTGRGHADRFWAIAVACQKERGPAPRTGTEIGVRMVG